MQYLLKSMVMVGPLIQNSIVGLEVKVDDDNNNNNDGHDGETAHARLKRKTEKEKMTDLM